VVMVVAGAEATSVVAGTGLVIYEESHDLTKSVAARAPTTKGTAEA